MATHSGAKIANGASLSGAIDLDGWVIVGITFPSAWTAADVSLASSTSEGGTYVPVYDADGTELVIQADASRHVVVAPDATRSLKWAKIRSGTNAAAVNQGAERSLTIHLAQESAS